MRRVYLDSETTDLTPGQICQLSYFIEDNGKIIKTINHYFDVKEISESAAQVNGFTLEKLKKLSDGMRFSDVAFLVNKDLQDNIIIGHNISFDERFVRAELYRKA
jgi:DNA polymerase III alpha subunit (gram-positive type)